jgi:uncharacterized membrane protein YdjX (TVP38/TMEM64 family)
VTTPPTNAYGPESPWRRALALLLVFAVLAALLSLDALFTPLQRLLAAGAPLIATHPVLGGLIFVLLSALSAMLAFFSSAVLVPVAVVGWGKPLTAALLWLGWLLGGLCTYAIGRGFGRPLLGMRGAEKALAFYRRRLSARLGLPVVFLLQLGLPSEIPGYLCGLLQVRLRTYAIALALAELPYAIGTVWVGESIVQRQGGWLLALGAAAVAISAGALFFLHRHLHR